MKKKTDLGDVHHRLRVLLEKHAGHLDVREDSLREYSLYAVTMMKGKEVPFGSVSRGKTGVVFSLEAVAVAPSIGASLSPGLEAKKKGKWAFTFRSADDVLFKELASMVDRSFSAFRASGLASP